MRVAWGVAIAAGLGISVRPGPSPRGGPVLPPGAAVDSGVEGTRSKENKRRMTSFVADLGTSFVADPGTDGAEEVWLSPGQWKPAGT